MAFTPQNFKPFQANPSVTAAWLNGIDVTCNFVLNGAQTVAAAQAALGITNGGVPPFPLTILNGGTGTTSASAALAALGGTTLQAAETAINPSPVQTVAETAALVNFITALAPVNFQYPESDIRRYGALTSLPDNSTFINAALAVSASGGAAVYVPGGTWHTQNPCIAPPASSMQGAGTSSIIQPVSGVDGIQFVTSDAGLIPRSRFFKDFQIQGTLSGTVNPAHGLYINAGAITGVLFSNLSVLNFQYGAFVQGLYDSTFFACFIQNCWQGIYFNNQSVNIWINCCLLQLVSAGTQITGPGYSQGISVQGAPEVEGLHVIGGSLDAYDYSFFLNLIFEVQIEAVDISFSTICPIYFTSAIGPIAIRDCWIELASSASGTWNNKVAIGDGNLTGIFITAITPNTQSKVIIEGNKLNADTFVAGSVGLYIGNSNNGIVADKNQILGFDVGVGGGNTLVNTGGTFTGGSIKNNSINATTTGVLVASGCAELDLGPNYIINAATRYSFTGGTPISMRFVQIDTPMKGRVTFQSSTSASVTFTNPLPVGILPTVSVGGNSAGYCWVVGQSNTGFIINCSAPSASSTDWSISL